MFHNQISTYVIVHVGSVLLRNLFPPYSIQERPEPQICQKFVPAIVFWGFQSRGQKLEKKRNAKL